MWPAARASATGRGGVISGRAVVLDKHPARRTCTDRRAAGQAWAGDSPQLAPVRGAGVLFLLPAAAGPGQDESALTRVPGGAAARGGQAGNPHQNAPEVAARWLDSPAGAVPCLTERELGGIEVAVLAGADRRTEARGRARHSLEPADREVRQG